MNLLDYINDPIISPILTLILLGLLRYATSEIKAAISSNNQKVIEKVASLEQKVDRGMGKLEEHDNWLQRHDVAIARLEGARDERTRIATAAGAVAAIVQPKEEGDK